MKTVYVLATEQAEPVSMQVLRGAFESEDVTFTAMDPASFALQADETRIEVTFQQVEESIPWPRDLIQGSPESQEALFGAKGLYRIAFEPVKPQGTVSVFEALWCARSIMEHVPAVLLDVSAFKVHDPEDVLEITELDFDIRDHVNLHAVEVADAEAPLWVHSHGMEKFGSPDVEIFYLNEQDLLPAESFIHELCTDLAFGQGPQLRTWIETSSGQGFMLAPADEARTNLMGVPLDAFEGHEGVYLTIVSPEGRHNLSEFLRPYRERFEQEPAERTAALKGQAKVHLPAFKARFHRKGLMEPLSFLVRAPFETHPEDEAVVEHLWLEVVSWEEAKVNAKLLDGATHTTEWRKGAVVELEEDQIDALALSKEGRPLDDDEMRALLVAERPV